MFSRDSSESQMNHHNGDSKSFEGRAMSNNYAFQLPNFMAKPENIKARYIPSYNPNINNQMQQNFYKPALPIGN